MLIAPTNEIQFLKTGRSKLSYALQQMWHHSAIHPTLSRVRNKHHLNKTTKIVSLQSTQTLLTMFYIRLSES